jgi:hypothetical protein
MSDGSDSAGSANSKPWFDIGDALLLAGPRAEIERKIKSGQLKNPQPLN